MNLEIPADAADAYEEIVGLIDTMHRSSLRLEALTAGQIDTVSDRTGRTVVLEGAQQYIRYRGAAKQAAILNALPANIALVDPAGVVVSVNDAWRSFATANGLQGPAFAVGTNYLDICDEVKGADAQCAALVAAGIRDVLTGAQPDFSIEYACDSPTEPRWFLLTVTALGEQDLSGAVLMHLDITTRRLAEESLKTSESRFQQLAQNIRDVFFLFRADMSQVLYVSPAYAQLWGRTCASLYDEPASLLSAIVPEDRARVSVHFSAGRTQAFEQEFRILRPDGETRWVHIRAAPILDDSGIAFRIAGLATDITPRKQSEIRIKRLNRVYAVMSGINSLIVRARDRDELFREACRIAVEEGWFRLSWIGMVDRGLKKIVPAASAGADAGFLDAVRERLSLREDSPWGRGITATAVKEKHAIVVNDAARDPRIAYKEVHAERGVLSLISLPLMIGGEAIAIFDLHAGEVDFFDAAEVKLLRELASNLAFAIENIGKRERLDYVAYYDMVTGLANRTLFVERMTQSVRSAVRGGHKLALYMIDIERFRSINDSLGRMAGDALLKQVAQWLILNVGDASRLTRVGADQFCIVLPEIKRDGDVARYLNRTMEAFLEHPFVCDGVDIWLTVKVGVALFPEDGKDAETLLRHAEAALKNAKSSGSRYLFYTQKMTESMADNLARENSLRRALENGEFILCYQPKVSMRDGKLAGLEALIRWNDPHSGIVLPNDFIPSLEETGLIHPVGRWVLRQAIDDQLRWRAAGLTAVRVAVNVSAVQLRDPGFIAEIEHLVGIHPHAAAGLELEITESLIMEDVKHNVATLDAIRALGVTTAIDDFGTGFSSLSYLSRLPVDTLKIDRSFVVDMVATQQGRALVATIINLGHSLKLTVVAEGVETEEQSRLLRLLDCDQAQGYLYSRPLPCKLLEAQFLKVAAEG